MGGNINIDLKEIRCKGMDWLHLAEERDQLQALVNVVGSEPSDSIKYKEFLSDW
jgi:hypothetical protein